MALVNVTRTVVVKYEVDLDAYPGMSLAQIEDYEKNEVDVVELLALLVESDQLDKTEEVEVRFE